MARSMVSNNWRATSSASNVTRFCEGRECSPHQVVKPQARVLAESRGIRWVEIDYDALGVSERPQMRLF